MIWVALQKTFIASSASSAPSTLGVAMSISTSCAISGQVCSTAACSGARPASCRNSYTLTSMRSAKSAP